MKRKQIIAKLEEIGVDYDSTLNKPELEELLTRSLTDIEDIDEAIDSVEEDETEASTEDTPTEQAPTEDDKKTTVKFEVLDSNGKIFRVVKTEEEASSLAKHIRGRIKR